MPWESDPIDYDPIDWPCITPKINRLFFETMSMYTKIALLLFAVTFSICSNADLQKGKAANKSKDDRVAFRSLKALANKGDAGAQYNFGVLYSKGQGTVKDEASAVKWYRKAAEQNHISAQFNLASDYEKGEGVDKDEAQAVYWYRKAADQGDNQAQNNLRLYV